MISLGSCRSGNRQRDLVRAYVNNPGSPRRRKGLDTRIEPRQLGCSMATEAADRKARRCPRPLLTAPVVCVVRRRSGFARGEQSFIKMGSQAGAREAEKREGRRQKNGKTGGATAAARGMLKTAFLSFSRVRCCVREAYFRSQAAALGRLGK